MNTPVVRRIDRILIRLPDPAYDRLYTLLADGLGLPISWPVTYLSAFKSSGLFAGNVDLELMRLATDPPGEEGRYFALVFEAWSDNLQELNARSIPYLPYRYIAESSDSSQPLWTDIYFDRLLGSNFWMTMLFAAKRLAPDWLWRRFSTRNATTPVAGYDFLFNRVFRNGAIMMKVYHPDSRTVDLQRRASMAELIERDGGPLGLVKVQEVGIGTTNLTAAAIAWRNLLRPAIEVDAMCWQAGDGPAIRLVAADQDVIRYLIWEVESLARAHDVLEEMQLVGSVFDDQIVLNSDLLCGLTIRLVETPFAD